MTLVLRRRHQLHAAIRFLPGDSFDRTTLAVTAARFTAHKAVQRRRGARPGGATRPAAAGHSGCRQEPELGSARTETAGQSSPPAAAHVDAIGNDWNTAPACVLSTVWGTASVRDLAVEVGAVPASPIRQVLTSRQASCAGRNSPRARKPVDLWTTPRGVAHKPTGPTTAADNLNLEISSVRTTPGSHSQDPHATSAAISGLFNALCSSSYRSGLRGLRGQRRSDPGRWCRID